jgi:hypothetical protein
VLEATSTKDHKKERVMDRQKGFSVVWAGYYLEVALVLIDELAPSDDEKRCELKQDAFDYAKSKHARWVVTFEDADQALQLAKELQEMAGAWVARRHRRMRRAAARAAQAVQRPRSRRPCRSGLHGSPTTTLPLFEDGPQGGPMD